MKVIYAETILPENILRELMKRTGAKTVEEAVIMAVEHYLACPNGSRSHHRKLRRNCMRK
jgi:hypothetical protein